MTELRPVAEISDDDLRRFGKLRRRLQDAHEIKDWPGIERLTIEINRILRK